MAIKDYTYEQIKALPDDQKTLVLKELKNLFPENKALAAHLNVLPIVTANLMGKYVEGKQVGRQKMTPEQKAEAKAARELKKQQEALAQKLANSESSNVVPQPQIPTAVVVDKPTPVISEPVQAQIKTNGSSFSIKLEKNVVGEEVAMMLSGIGSTLIKDKNYQISLVVEEV